jgi:DNA polymerase-3 subunit beta
MQRLDWTCPHIHSLYCNNNLLLRFKIKTMKLTASREDILTPLQSVIGVVERRQTMPILANVLLSARENRLSITGTDLEVELVAAHDVGVQQAGDITVPGRKLLDIFRTLPEKASVTLSTEGERVSLRAGRSRFTLSSLPASEFPVVEEINSPQVVSVAQAELRKLIDKTHFSMAQQDVRYYLNGMLLETEGKSLRAVATDGHRLALCATELASMAKTAQQVIVPRKGVLELQRILGAEGTVELAIGANHVRVQIGDIRFTSKLIDGRFPEYGRVVPANPSKVMEADRELMKQAFQRTAILSNEKYRGIRLTLKGGLLTVQAHNPEQEEAEDQLEVTYSGEDIEVGFNVNYLLDALTALQTEKVEIGLSDANSSCLIRSPGTTDTKYVVMPMRL